MKKQTGNKQKNTVTGVVFILFSMLLATEGYFAYGNVFFEKVISPISPLLSHIEMIGGDRKHFSAPELTAQHAIVYDIKNDVILYEKDPYVIHPVASITKVVSALVSNELLGPNHSIVIDGNALAQDSDNGLLLNETWSFNKLLDFSLLVSSNDGAYAIASIAGSLLNDVSSSNQKNSSIETFVDLMNKKMRDLGLRNMHFNNPSGLDLDESVSGGYGTAFEIAKLFEYITENNYEVLEATQLQSLQISSKNNIVHNATNTNIGLDEIPALLASKTGYTDLAGGNLAIVFDTGINHPIAIVVLESSYQERFVDVSKLVKATTEFFAK